MENDPVSFLRSAIERRAEITFTMIGVPIVLRPYVLYEALGNRLTIAGLSHLDIPTHVPVSQIQNLAATGYSFEPEPSFNLGDPRYRNALAIIELG